MRGGMGRRRREGEVGRGQRERGKGAKVKGKEMRGKGKGGTVAKVLHGQRFLDVSFSVISPVTRQWPRREQ